MRYGASEILTSLMLVYVADLFMDYLVRSPWRDPHGLNFPTTAEFDPVATVPSLIEGSRLHAGAILVLILVMLASVLLGRTIKGFEIRVVGAAPKAAGFAGFKPRQLVLFTFAVSGALAGLAGIIEVAGPIGPCSRASRRATASRRSSSRSSAGPIRSASWSPACFSRSPSSAGRARRFR